MEYSDFLAWAQKREPLIQDDWLSKECFNFALQSTQAVKQYLSPINYLSYVFSYALHLIIVTPLDTNDLYKKYFPNGNKLGLGIAVGSASDVDTSYSTLAYNALQNMSFEEALNIETPYGMYCNTILQSLRNAIVVV